MSWIKNDYLTGSLHNNDTIVKLIKFLKHCVHEKNEPLIFVHYTLVSRGTMFVVLWKPVIKV